MCLPHTTPARLTGEATSGAAVGHQGPSGTSVQPAASHGHDETQPRVREDATQYRTQGQTRTARQTPLPVGTQLQHTDNDYVFLLTYDGSALSQPICWLEPTTQNQHSRSKEEKMFRFKRHMQNGKRKKNRTHSKETKM